MAQNAAWFDLSLDAVILETSHNVIPFQLRTRTTKELYDFIVNLQSSKNAILPDYRLRSNYLLMTNSWNFVHELPCNRSALTQRLERKTNQLNL